ncbi:alpha/beta hydrolase [Halomonas huangheensis]|uniref:Esterase n=1 Tax=Halomonas huangheensis TaxID=1178482 RepID=W1N2Z8_9GAMM|nr:alpha/beta hydrolase-fold protein [Halomonas huangheensis]ALM51125.1 hypothetical protein AR456_01590 [Halomonas huangheensis]ERL49561.1 hypothetical protein BJB45_00030 [Halomonas huangheensis]
MAMMPVSGQVIASPDREVESTPVQLPRSEAFAVPGERMGEDYWIEVAQPAQPAPEQGYRVVYVLDGNARMPLLREARETLTRQGPEGGGSPLLIVGIGYPGVERFDIKRRAEDFLPAHGSVDRDASAEGGAAGFLAFIERRLKPLIAGRYPVDASRQALFGHSFGGLFTLYVMRQCPQCFRDYIAISPSLWWQDGELMTQLRDGAADSRWCSDLSERRLLLGVGGEEQSPGPADREPERDILRQRRAMVDNTIDLGHLLQSGCRSLDTTLEVYPGEDHGSVLWPASRSAIERLSVLE